MVDAERKVLSFCGREKTDFLVAVCGCLSWQQSNTGFKRISTICQIAGIETEY